MAESGLNAESSPLGLNVVSHHNVEAGSKNRRQGLIFFKVWSYAGGSRRDSSTFGTECCFAYLGSDYLGSENSRSQMYYLCHDIFIFSQLWLTSHPRSTEMCFLWSEILDR